MTSINTRYTVSSAAGKNQQLGSLPGHIQLRIAAIALPEEAWTVKPYY